MEPAKKKKKKERVTKQETIVNTFVDISTEMIFTHISRRKTNIKQKAIWLHSNTSAGAQLAHTHTLRTL